MDPMQGQIGSAGRNAFHSNETVEETFCSSMDNIPKSSLMAQSETGRDGEELVPVIPLANVHINGNDAVIETQKAQAFSFLSRNCWIRPLIVLVVMLATILAFRSRENQPAPSAPLQKRPHATLRPVETPPPRIPSQESSTTAAWTPLGDDLLGSQKGGAFGKFVTLSSDGKRMAITSTAAEDPSVSLFEIQMDGSVASLSMDTHIDGVSPYYATISGDGSYFVVAETNNGSDNSLTHQIQFLEISNDGIATGRPALYLNGLYDTYYGRPVAVSHSAKHVAVGIDGWEAGGKSHVQVYEDSQDGGWRQIGSDIVGRGAFSEFGNTVCISSDGRVLAVADRSEFRTFEIDDSTGEWKEMSVSSEIGTTRGEGVERIALSSNGKTIAVSGDGIRVYQFREEQQQWIQIGDTIEADADYEYYNLDRVALSGDGLTLATGTNNVDSADVSDHVIGYVRVYRLVDGKDWRQVGERLEGTKSSEAFGSSLSLSEDGSRLVVSAPGNEEYKATVGAVRVYDLM